MIYTEADLPCFSPHMHTMLTPPDSGQFLMGSMHMNAILYVVALEMH